ncbi:hypothetical protein [Bailinhaonella thermotolerans]|uniref:Uncharacterized protein n=1 Tax=Bailinhaonella thermotolerans TaxID=1070861 RepID=A0A3A4AZM2_9ACTN|nr:hypothetical protein [Bailinhaonella thermotolerans]RJL24822.1 hypothetical protein D5H75_29015 [Bailinhaonella thermotolerans]
MADPAREQRIRQLQALLRRIDELDRPLRTVPHPMPADAWSGQAADRHSADHQGRLQAARQEISTARHTVQQELTRLQNERD